MEYYDYELVFDNSAMEREERDRLCRVVADPATHESVLRAYSYSDHPYEEPVLVALLYNPRCPRDVIERLSHHYSTDVQRAAAERLLCDGR